MPLNSNGIMEDPVSVGDVASALGSTSTDVATLCTDANVNKAAIYRPRRITFPYLMLDSTGFNTMKGMAAMANYECMDYAVWVPYCTSAAKLWDTCQRTWEVLTPGDNDYKNLAHFSGYNKNAKFVGAVASDPVVQVGSVISVNFQRATATATGANAISINNLFNGTDDNGDLLPYYYGFGVYEYTGETGNYNTGSTPKLFISPYEVGNGTRSVVTTAAAYATDGTQLLVKDGYKYCIMPFIAYMPTAGDVARFYSARLGTGIESYYDSSTADGIRLSYFYWKESSCGEYYPEPISSPHSALDEYNGTGMGGFLFALCMTYPTSTYNTGIINTSGTKIPLINISSLAVSLEYTSPSDKSVYTASFSYSAGEILINSGHNGWTPYNILRFTILDKALRTKLFGSSSHSLPGYADSFVFKATFTINVTDGTNSTTQTCTYEAVPYYQEQDDEIGLDNA